MDNDTLAKLRALQAAAGKQYEWEKPIDAAASQVGDAMRDASDRFGRKVDQFVDPSAVQYNRPGGMGQALPSKAPMPQGDPQSDANFQRIMAEGAAKERAMNGGVNPADQATQQRLDTIESLSDFNPEKVSPEDKAFMKERDPQRFAKIFGGM